jgi:hypothetical protein
MPPLALVTVIVTGQFLPAVTTRKLGPLKQLHDHVDCCDHMSSLTSETVRGAVRPSRCWQGSLSCISEGSFPQELYHYPHKTRMDQNNPPAAISDGQVVNCIYQRANLD